jgi:hypothetical protein
VRSCGLALQAFVYVCVSGVLLSDVLLSLCLLGFALPTLEPVNKR